MIELTQFEAMIEKINGKPYDKPIESFDGPEVRVEEDKEQEYFFTLVEEFPWGPDPVRYPTWINNDMPYSTSGMTPDAYPQAHKNDIETTAAGFMPEDIIPPDRQFYSQSRYGTGSIQERNFHNWMGAICKTDKVQARRLWSAFWKELYDRKEKGIKNAYREIQEAKENKRVWKGWKTDLAREIAAELYIGKKVSDKQLHPKYCDEWLRSIQKGNRAQTRRKLSIFWKKYSNRIGNQVVRQWLFDSHINIIKSFFLVYHGIKTRASR